MKNIIFKYIMISLALMGLTQSCVKESYEGDNIGESGTTFLKTPDGGDVVRWLRPFENTRKVSLFDVFKDAHNSFELNSSNTVKIKIVPSLVDDYNDENDTEYEVLPSDFYSWDQNDQISFAGDELSVKFGAGKMYGDIAIKLDGSKWTDLTQQYALAFVITDYGNIKPSVALSDTVIVRIGLKNDWDGVYSMVGKITDVASPAFSHVSIQYAAQGYGDYEVQLQTIGETKVVLYDGILWKGFTYPVHSGTGWSGYGSFAPVFEFDPVTNKIISVTNVFGQPSSNTRSAGLDPSGENYYDPVNKVIKVKYFMYQPSSVPDAPHIRAIIDEEYKFVSER